MTEGEGLDGSLGFQLKMLLMASDAAARRALEAFCISPARVAALMLINANPGCTQSALGNALSVNRASAMKLVNFLEERGLVSRQASADPRAHALHLTPHGVVQLEGMAAALESAEEQVMSILPKADRQHLFRMLRQLRTGFEAFGHAASRQT